MSREQEAILAITRQILCTYPSLRIGQLFANLTQPSEHDIYHLPDTELLKRLREYQSTLAFQNELPKHHIYKQSEDK